MARKSEALDEIKARLDSLYKMGIDLQQYVHELRSGATSGPRTIDIIEELLKLETKLSVVNEILYQERYSPAIENAIDRLKWKD
jgi:hypothetical protein